MHKGQSHKLLGMSGMLQKFKDSLGMSVDLVSVGGLEPRFPEEVENAELKVNDHLIIKNVIA